jgi:tetratricopeptide (TPR) repeat protein
MASLTSTRFVGRTDELARLEAALSAAVAGSPRTVLVGAEAGVGKTRLVSEFLDRARTNEAQILAGSCFEFSGGGLPYGPIVEALRKLTRPLDSPAREAALGPGRAELERLLPIEELHHEALLAVPASGSTQARLFELFLRTLDGLGAATGVVLVVEDLHWADQSTLDLLAFLVRNLRHEHVVIIATFRSEELHGRPLLRTILAELERSGSTERMELASFSREELATHLGDIRGSPPTVDIVDRIFAWSEGNAFFAEELFAADVEQERFPLPERLRDIILARFETLSEDAKVALRVVAAAGGRVRHLLVAAAAQIPEQALLPALRETVERHFLVADAESSTYIFRHALVRETIYSDLLPGELINLHSAIARVLSEDPSLDGEPDPLAAAELAHHWVCAGNIPRALDASVQAGRSAARIYGFAEAHRQMERALQLWPRVPSTARKLDLPFSQLLEEASEYALWAGDIDRSVTLVREALSNVDPSDEPARAGMLQYRLGRSLYRSGDVGGSLAAHEASNDLFRDQPDSAEKARVMGGYAGALMIAGRYSESRRQSEVAVAMAETVGALPEKGYALNSLGVSLTLEGYPNKGINALREAKTIAEKKQDYADVSRAHTNLSFALEKAGMVEEAAKEALQGLESVKKFDAEMASAYLLLNAADLLFLLGRWKEVDNLLSSDPRLETSNSFGPWLHTIRANLAMGMGRFDEAQDHLEIASKEKLRDAGADAIGPLQACMAELAIWRNDYSAALSAVREGLRLLAEREAGYLAIVLCALGLRAQADEATRSRDAGTNLTEDAEQPNGMTLLTQARDIAQNVTTSRLVLPESQAWLRVCEAEYMRLHRHSDPDLWEAAAELWITINQPYRGAYTLWRQAEALIACNAVDDAVPILRQSYEIAERIGAKPLREQLDSLGLTNGIDLHRVD